MSHKENKLIQALKDVQAAVTKSTKDEHDKTLDQLTKLALILAPTKIKQVRFNDSVKPPRVETTTPTPGNCSDVSTNLSPRQRTAQAIAR